MPPVADLDAAARELAAEHGTPFYLFSEAVLLDRIAQITGPFERVEVDYSVKTNYELGLLRRIAAAGCGASIGSEIELALAREAGFEPARVCLDGPAKSEALIAQALAWGVRAINVDSAEELERLAGADARLLLRLQIPPGWRGGIAEAASGRFGVPLDQVPALLPRVQGLAVHLGSQLASSKPHVRWLDRLRRMAADAAELNLGGGFPSPHLRRGLLRRAAPSLDAFVAPIARAAASLEAQLVLEPGRAIVGPAGWLYGSVTARKGRWLFLDAGRNMLPESMIFATREVGLVAEREGPCERVHLAGPTLSSADVLGFRVALPAPRAGDLIRLADAGAYSLSRVNRFGTWIPPAWILTTDGRVEPLRKPDRLEDVLGPMV